MRRRIEPVSLLRRKGIAPTYRLTLVAAEAQLYSSIFAGRGSARLPSNEKVQTLLDDLGIDPKSVPQALQETLRRPFALRLFVELIDRGVDVSQVKLPHAWCL